MSKYWGISYNRWHLILTLIGTAAFIPAAAFFLKASWGLTAILACSVFSLPFWVFFHAINEAAQAIDPEVENIYGSWQAFQEDSRDDWKNSFIGWLLGIPIGAIIGVLV